MPFETLILDAAGDIATITLNRPEKRNAISAQMMADLMAAFDEVEAGPARLLILTGAGKAFCSGMDLDALKSLASQSPAQHLDDARRLAVFFRRIWSFPKPTIAAVNGHAIAGGCGIATLCDITIAVPEARFGYPEVRIGFLPAVVSVFLARQVGEKQARDLLLTGKTIAATEAHRIGLVTQLASADALPQTAQETAEAIIAASPASVAVTKRLLCEFAAPEVERELEFAIAESARVRATDDFREGLSSFLEKRAPNWGRQK